MTISRIAPFLVKDRNGLEFQVVCQRHKKQCWRLVINNSSKKYAGDLLFEPKNAATVELWDFHIFREFAGKGVGVEVINKWQDLLRERGFHTIIGVCKSHDRPLSEKEKLAQWYQNLGFKLDRESMETAPGYIGRLSKNI
jgi:GNAT superfamily N-acetyltransferase